LYVLLLTLGGAALGAALGFFIAQSRTKGLRKRARELEQELDRTQTELIAYRSRVGQHLSDTGDLLKSLALNLCDTYEHLAEGAHELCPNEIKSLRPGHAAEELLIVTGGAPPRLDNNIVEPLETDDALDSPQTKS